MEWPWKKYSDIRCVEGIRDGCEDIQKHLYLRCRSQFDLKTSRYEFIREAEKQDLFQDSFVILWEKIENQQIFVEDGKVYAWKRDGRSVVPDLIGYFMRIVKNLYHEMLREKGRILEIIDELDDASVLWWSDDNDIHRRMIITQAVLLLPPSCKEIVMMFYYQGLSLNEIVEEREENKSYDGVKNEKSKCLRNLRERILARCADEGVEVPGMSYSKK